MVIGTNWYDCFMLFHVFVGEGVLGYGLLFKFFVVHDNELLIIDVVIVFELVLDELLDVGVGLGDVYKRQVNFDIELYVLPLQKYIKCIHFLLMLFP